ncbi:MAG: response regulator [Elusimicrobia bacterium]|nr:response regulator [Elusimicrobiota bacterium]
MALVLVADDTPEVAELLRDLLESRGHQVAVVADGVGLIERAKSIAPKLIVSDIMMPGTYGSSAYKALQDDAHTRGIPVLFVTGVTPQQAEKVVPASPRVRVLHKPLDVLRVLKAVEELLGAA